MKPETAPVLVFFNPQDVRPYMCKQALFLLQAVNRHSQVCVVFEN